MVNSWDNKGEYVASKHSAHLMSTYVGYNYSPILHSFLPKNHRGTVRLRTANIKYNTQYNFHHPKHEKFTFPVMVVGNEEYLVVEPGFHTHVTDVFNALDTPQLCY